MGLGAGVSGESRVLSAIQALYDAALDESLWPRALEGLTDLTGSQAATFWVLDSNDTPRLPTLIVVNFDPSFMAEYLDGMVPMDPTVQYLVSHPDVTIFHDGQVIRERDKDRHAYYDWHGSRSDTRYRMVGQIRPAPAVQAGVALHRTRHAGSYGQCDLDQFALVYPHLQRALSIGSRLGTLGAMQQCGAELLERSESAVFLLDEHCRVVYANRRAEALAAAHDGLAMSAGGLTLERKGDQDRLEALLGRTLKGPGAPGSSGGGVMRAARPSGRQSYVIRATSVSPRYPALSTFRPAACVIVSDPESQRPAAAERLQSAFELTAAEARLAALLATGEELRSAAARLGITYGTARTRLASIFVKTGARRQGELIALLLAAMAG